MRTLLLLPLCCSTPLLAQVMNGDFETTTITPQDVVVPVHWSSETEFGCGLVDEAHSGTYAFGVWNWYWYAEGKANNGSTWLSGREGTPVSGHPTQLTGWYKRELGYIQPGATDEAVVSVLLTRWAPVAGQRDTVASGIRLFGEQATWAPFTVDITYMSALEPDTVVVQLRSCGDCFCDTNADGGTCAYFTVDDLALSFAQGVTEPLMREGAVQLIDQHDGTVRVDVIAGTPLPVHLQVYDARGRTVADVAVGHNGQVVALPQASGLLAYRASANGLVLGAGRVVVP